MFFHSIPIPIPYHSYFLVLVGFRWLSRSINSCTSWLFLSSFYFRLLLCIRQIYTVVFCCSILRFCFAIPFPYSFLQFCSSFLLEGCSSFMLEGCSSSMLECCSSSLLEGFPSYLGNSTKCRSNGKLLDNSPIYP